MQPVAGVKAKPQTPLCNAISALLWKLCFHMAHNQHSLLEDREPMQRLQHSHITHLWEHGAGGQSTEPLKRPAQL